MISMAAFAVQAPSAYSNAYLRNTICGTLGICLSKSNFGRWPSNGGKRTALPSVSLNGDGRTEELFVHTVDDERFVCEIAKEMSQPPPYAYWVRFPDVRRDRAGGSRAEQG